MKLQDMIQPMDALVYFPKKNDLLDKLITKATFGKFNHASLVFDKDTIFETDGDMFKAGYTPMADVEGRHVVIIRPLGVEGKYDQFKALCEKYKGYPYGYGDLLAQGLFFWLAAPIRRKVVSFFGAKPFMYCSELDSRIWYELMGFEELRQYEGITPEDFYEIAKIHTEHFLIAGEYTGA